MQKNWEFSSEHECFCISVNAFHPEIFFYLVLCKAKLYITLQMFWGWISGTYDIPVQFLDICPEWILGYESHTAIALINGFAVFVIDLCGFGICFRIPHCSYPLWVLL